LWEKFDLVETNIEIEFNPPTNFYEMREAQRLDQKVQAYNNIATSELISQTFAQKKYLKWKDQDILANREFMRKDAEFQWELQQIATSGPSWKEITIGQNIEAGIGGPSEAGFQPSGGSGGGIGGEPPPFTGGPAATTPGTTGEEPSPAAGAETQAPTSPA
jgi:hypothetical protein